MFMWGSLGPYIVSFFNQTMLCLVSFFFILNVLLKYSMEIMIILRKLNSLVGILKRDALRGQPQAAE